MVAPNRKLIGKNLQKKRRDAGFSSARAFAEHMGISKDTYTGYEQGRIPMSYERAWQFADALGCTLDELGGRNFEPACEPDHEPEYESFAHEFLNDRYKSFTIEGKQKLVNYAIDLDSSGSYIKRGVQDDTVSGTAAEVA